MHRAISLFLNDFNPSSDVPLECTAKCCYDTKALLALGKRGTANRALHQRLGAFSVHETWPNSRAWENDEGWVTLASMGSNRP